MLYRILVVFALSGASLSAGLLTESVDCLLLPPTGPALTFSESKSSLGSPSPDIRLNSDCVLGEIPTSNPPSESFFFVLAATSVFDFGDRASVTTVIDAGEVPLDGWTSGGSGFASADFFWTTGGPARSGFLDLTYTVLGDASFEIAGFDCSNCTGTNQVLIPFELGVPFRIQAQAQFVKLLGSGEEFSTTIVADLNFTARELDGTVVEFNPVPEPGTLVFTLLGLGALIGRRRFRRLKD